MVAQTQASWNRVLGWLQQMDLLRKSDKFAVVRGYQNSILVDHPPF